MYSNAADSTESNNFRLQHTHKNDNVVPGADFYGFYLYKKVSMRCILFLPCYWKTLFYRPSLSVFSMLLPSEQAIILVMGNLKNPLN